MAITLNPVAADAGGNALTDPADIEGALVVALPVANITAVTSVSIVTVCGDSICSPGEPSQKGVDDDTSPAGRVCTKDCPVKLGECDAPPSSGVGHSTRQCGGNGLCIATTLTCSCFPGYARNCDIACGTKVQVCDVHCV